MKWLTSAFLCVLAVPALAQDLDGIVRLPTALLCGPQSNATEQRILEEYGELPFLQGDGDVMSPDINLSYQGKVRFFLDPDDYSYSVFLDLGDQFTCLVVTGDRIDPSPYGDGI